MKIKNLNFLEKHIEKIAIGIGLAFFALVMWLFVLGEPYTIDVVTRSGTQTVTPDKVEVMIRDEARKLEQSYKKPETPFDEIPLPKWTDDFRGRMTGRFLPVDRLAMPLNMPGLDKSMADNVLTEKQLRIIPTPPAVAKITAQADYAVLAAPSDDETGQNLIKLVGNLPQPRDFRYVSVAASFEMEQWRERLKGQNVASDQRIPEDWWRNRLNITNVILERQTLDPTTGQWGNITVIPSLPSGEPQKFQVDGNGEIKLTAAEVPGLLDTIRDTQERIVRPDFVELERGVWSPPGSQHQLTEEQAKQLAEIQQKLAQLRRRDQAMQNAGRTTTPAAPVAPVAREPEDEWNQPGNPRPNRPAPRAGGTAPSTVQGQIAELESQRNALLGIAPTQTSEQQGPDAMGRPRDGVRRDPANRNNTRFGEPRDPREPRPRWTRDGLAPQPGQDADAVVPAIPPVTLWAHDITTRPGETYRYRVTVELLNPLFHINDVQREQYTEYFNKLSLRSEPGPWSEAVRVDPELYYFLTDQDAARRQVTVDVFRIFNGVWMRRSFDVRPGDAIGNAVEVTYQNRSQALDLNTNAMVVDIAFPASEMSAGANSDQTRAITYNLQNQAMQARVLGQDLADRTYQRLLSEMQIRSAMASSGQ